MSSNESSGAAAEGSATTPAPAAPASFGSTRGSGLARGKRQSNSPASTTAAASPSGYKPTAIEIVNAPREYQNPFAPAESAPVAETPESVVKQSLPESTPAVVAAKADVTPSEDIAAPEADTVAKAELNILPPERPKVVAAQTWESDGFKAPAQPERSERSDRPERFERPRRDERVESDEPLDPASIPEKFLYVRPGVTFVPTDPRKWGPGRRDPSPERAGGLAPRESSPVRESSPSHAASAPAEAPRQSGGLFGWIKSLFGGGSAEPTTAGHARGEHRGHRSRHENRGESAGGPRSEGPGGDRRHRGGGRRRRGGRGRGEGPAGARNGDAT